MGIKKYKPTSPGRRFASVLTYEEITCWEPERSLVESRRRTGGRNNKGRITSRFRGGGNKRKYRIIDFKRRKDGVPAKVHSIQYDPGRSAFIALLHYLDGAKSYILAPRRLKVGDLVYSGEEVNSEIGYKPGVCLPLRTIPPGMEIHNIELDPGRGGKLVRSAGMAARLSAKEGSYVVVILPSGELRRIHHLCRATIGRLGNLDHQNVRLGKAGRKRHRGRRPHVRGVAQNPIAHHMGGGEGRSGGGRHPCSPWGKLSKGAKTRKKNKTSDQFIIRRRSKR